MGILNKFILFQTSRLLPNLEEVHQGYMNLSEYVKYRIIKYRIVKYRIVKYKIDQLTCETLILSRLGYRLGNVFLGIHFSISQCSSNNKNYCFTVSQKIVEAAREKSETTHIYMNHWLHSFLTKP